jgi:hypothetical protein
MSAMLFDLGDDKHDLMINNANWRATVDVFRTFGILDAERLHRLENAWLGERVIEEVPVRPGYARFGSGVKSPY